MKQLTGKALTDFLRRVTRPEIELAFVLQDVGDAVNVGAAFRIADACGVRELILTGASPTPPDSTIAGIGRGTHRRVPWRHTGYASEAIAALKEQGYTAYAVEVASGAVPYYDVTYPGKVCLVVGNEGFGVNRHTLAACDGAVYIPMYGKIQSLNVHVALAIIAFHILHSGPRIQ